MGDFFFFGDVFLDGDDFVFNVFVVDFDYFVEFFFGVVDDVDFGIVCCEGLGGYEIDFRVVVCDEGDVVFEVEKGVVVEVIVRCGGNVF